MKKLTVKLTAMLGCLFAYSEYTIAACVQNSDFNNLQSNIPSRVFTIQYDDTTVRNLDTLTVSYSSSTLNTYAPNSGECGPSYLRGNYVNGWTPDANSVAATNIPGIGVTIQTAGIGNFNASFGPSSSGVNSWQVFATTWTIVIKKTGVVTTTGSLTSGVVARFTQTNPAPYNSTWYLAALNMPANAIQIKVLSCSLKSSVPTINMGDWYDTQFKNIGDTSTDVDIPITLSCLPGTNIKATVTATSGADNPSQGQLSLSGANKATGVAIQLVDKAGQPIPLGIKNTIQNNVPNGDYIFGWKARYIKTASDITPGSANATATVNIRYE